MLITAAIHNERALADAILKAMPANEEDLAWKLAASKDQIRSLCEMLHKQGKIKVDMQWDYPRHWKLK